MIAVPGAEETMSARTLSRAALFLTAALVGCSDGKAPHYTYPEAGTRLDGIVWPDYGPLPDFKPWYHDGPTTSPDSTIPKDGAVASDNGVPTCPGPAAANCSSPCAPEEICTEAKGGTCTKQLVLKGAAADKAVLKVVASAFVSCWNKSPSADTLCSTFNTCGMTSTLTQAIVDDWVCNKAQVTDFSSPTEYDAARGIFQCSIWSGQFIYRPDWKITNIIAGKRGIVCLAYDVVSWNFDKINVNDCQYFPPS
jgi:hypothetical protein